MPSLVFSTDDVARVRIRLAPHQLDEALLSLTTLSANADILFEGWRRRLLHRPATWAEPLQLLAGACHSLDLFTIAGAAAELEDGLERVEGAQRHRMRGELAAARAWREPRGSGPARRWDPWIRLIPDDRDTRQEFVTLLRRCIRDTVGQRWPQISRHLHADAQRRALQLAKGGVEHLLANLFPSVRWESPVLRFGNPSYLFKLDGRGLELAPSVFCRFPILFVDCYSFDQPPILFYPAVSDIADALAVLAEPEGDGQPALDALLGRTRAAVLMAVSDGCSTTELARRAEISLAGASQHAASLRRAGLLTTTREGGAVRHRLTPLGANLVLQNGRY